MDILADNGLLIGGGVLLILGFLLWQRMSRYDLKGAAIDSAWHVALGRRTAERPTPIEEKLHGIASAETMTGKATRAAGTVIGHFIAQVVSLIALVMMLVGLVLIAAGIWWR
jgi:hypothetical protein